MPDTPSPPPPWYRQPLVWMLIAIPGLTVVAGIITIVIAVKSADGVVVDDYYKHGKAINQSLARDRAAAQMGLRAELLRGDGDQIRVVLNQAVAPELVLALNHATLPDRDQRVVLRSEDGRLFDGQLAPLSPGRWHIQLAPAADGDWRLRGQTADTDFRKLRLDSGRQP